LKETARGRRAMTPPVKRCGVLSEPTSVTEKPEFENYAQRKNYQMKLVSS
jgi:hypothetical protein